MHVQSIFSTLAHASCVPSNSHPATRPLRWSLTIRRATIVSVQSPLDTISQGAVLRGGARSTSHFRGAWSDGVVPSFPPKPDPCLPHLSRTFPAPHHHAATRTPRQSPESPATTPRDVHWQCRRAAARADAPPSSAPVRRGIRACRRDTTAETLRSHVGGSASVRVGLPVSVESTTRSLSDVPVASHERS